ncbi:MAG: Ca-activated chloride channel family protein [Saprospiraceae bacterium]
MNKIKQVSNLYFVNPGAFLLLLLIPIIWMWLRKQERFVKLRFSTLAGFSEGISIRAKLNIWLPNTLRLLTFLMLVIALARPQTVFEEKVIEAEGIDIIISMDISSSMLSEDFKPNRLVSSQKLAADFVDGRAYDRIGLTAFAGESFTKCPITTDHKIVKEFLLQLECGQLRDGTAIGMGLASSVKALSKSKAKSKVIILLTDGENNSGYIQPMTAVEMVKAFNIKVYTIGVGSTGEALTPMGRRADGSYPMGYAKVVIDEDLLKDISSKTGGKYFRATDENGLKKIYEEIDQLEKTKMEVEIVKRQSDQFFIFIFWAILFLGLEILLRNTIFRTI